MNHLVPTSYSLQQCQSMMRKEEDDDDDVLLREAAKSKVSTDDLTTTTSSSSRSNWEAFFASLSEPLKTYCREAIGAETVHGSGSSGGDDGREQASAAQRVDRFEIATRSHLLSLMDDLVVQSHSGSGNGNGNDAFQTKHMQHILEHIRGVIDFAVLVCRTASTSMPGTDQPDPDLHPDPGANDHDHDRSHDHDNKDRDAQTRIMVSQINTVHMRKLPFLLLEDAVDTLPTSILQTFWKYGPAHWLQSILCKTQEAPFSVTDTLFHQNQGSKYCLIRMCNKILKNLSTDAQDEAAQFAGEISMILASVFPLSERSAVNVLGAFHTDAKYRTEYESMSQWLDHSHGHGQSQGHSQGQSQNQNQGQGQAKGPNHHMALNYGFYAKFWGLQAKFTNPKEMLPRFNVQGKDLNPQWNAHLDSFLMDLRDILATFEGCTEFSPDVVHDLKKSWERIKHSSVVVVGDGGGGGNDLRNGIPADDTDADADADVDMKDNDIHEEKEDESTTKNRLGIDASAPSSTSNSIKRQYKYLTNSQLLRLQIQDPELRIHFLTQLYIISTYLSTSLATYVRSTAMSTSMSMSTSTSASTSASGSVLDHKTMCETFQSHLHQLEQRAGELIQKTPPNGAAHLDSLKWILEEREAVWRDWKKDKCIPPIEKYPVAHKTGNGNGSGNGKNGKDGKDGNQRGKFTAGALGTGGGISHQNTNTSITERSNQYLYTIDLEKELPSISKGMSQHEHDEMTQFFEEYADALDPEAGIEQEYHPKNNKLSSWRALRSLSKRHIGNLADWDDGSCMVNKKTGDFEGIVRKIWKNEKGIDIPGDMPAAPEISDDEVDQDGDENENDDGDGDGDGAMDEVMDGQEDEKKETMGGNEVDAAKRDTSDNVKKDPISDQGTPNFRNKIDSIKAEDARVTKKSDGDAEGIDESSSGKIDKTDITMEVDKKSDVPNEEKEDKKGDELKKGNDAEVKSEPTTSQDKAKVSETSEGEGEGKAEQEKSTKVDAAHSIQQPVDTESQTAIKPNDPSHESKDKTIHERQELKEAENTRTRKRKHDSVPNEMNKTKKVEEHKHDNSSAPKNGGRKIGNSTQAAHQNDDGRGRAPSQRSNNRSQRGRRTPEPRQPNHRPPQRRGGNDRGGEKGSQSPPGHPRREVHETRGGGQTHTRFLSPDGRDDRGGGGGGGGGGGRRGQPEPRRQSGGTGGASRQYHDRRNMDMGRNARAPHDDRRGMRDGGAGGQAGEQPPDRRGRGNDGGRNNAARNRSGGRRRN